VTIGILETPAVHEAEILSRPGIGLSSSARGIRNEIIDGLMVVEMQINTSLDVLASEIFFGVNCRNLSWVSSMTWMVSESTMQDAVLSENRSFLVAPIA
jgi:hypothetical protein